MAGTWAASGRRAHTAGSGGENRQGGGAGRRRGPGGGRTARGRSTHGCTCNAVAGRRAGGSGTRAIRRPRLLCCCSSPKWPDASQTAAEMSATVRCCGDGRADAMSPFAAAALDSRHAFKCPSWRSRVFWPRALLANARLRAVAPKLLSRDMAWVVEPCRAIMPPHCRHLRQEAPICNDPQDRIELQVWHQRLCYRVWCGRFVVFWGAAARCSCYTGKHAPSMLLSTRPMGPPMHACSPFVDVHCTYAPTHPLAYACVTLASV